VSSKFQSSRFQVPELRLPVFNLEPGTWNLELSVVVPSHCRADLLRLCLASLARFAPPGTEVIVVDDGSRGEVVSRAAAEFPGVRAVRRARPGGFCAAANAGVAAASAPVVELLNDDAEVTAGWADAALRWFADPRVVAVAPLVLQNDPARHAHGLPPLIDTAGDEYDPGGFAVKRGKGMVRASGGRQPPARLASALSCQRPWPRRSRQARHLPSLPRLLATQPVRPARRARTGLDRLPLVNRVSAGCLPRMMAALAHNRPLAHGTPSGKKPWRMTGPPGGRQVR